MRESLVLIDRLQQMIQTRRESTGEYPDEMYVAPFVFKTLEREMDRFCEFPVERDVGNPVVHGVEIKKDDEMMAVRFGDE